MEYLAKSNQRLPLISQSSRRRAIYGQKKNLGNSSIQLPTPSVIWKKIINFESGSRLCGVVISMSDGLWVVEFIWIYNLRSTGRNRKSSLCKFEIERLRRFTCRRLSLRSCLGYGHLQHQPKTRGLVLVQPCTVSLSHCGFPRHSSVPVYQK